MNTYQCYAQTNNIKFRHLTDQDGLSQNWIRAIHQDSYGFLWFGTDNAGINKYDGYSFKKYESNPDEESGLSSNTVYVFTEDSGHNLWAGTRKGINKYNREKDRFESYPLLPETYIIGIYSFDNGKLLIIADEIIYILDTENNTARNICGNQNDQCIRGDFLTNAVKDKYNNLWVGSSVGLWRIDTTSNKIIRYLHDKNDPNSIIGDIVTALYIDEFGRLWAGTRFNGISVMESWDAKNEKPEFIHLRHSADEKSISNGQIRIIENDHEGNIWIGTENGGLNILKREDLLKNNFVLDRYTQQVYDEHSLSSNSIYSVYLDNQETMWVGTFNGGLNYYNKLLFRFETHKPIPFNKNSLNNNFVNTFLPDGDNLWIGTEGGLNLLNTSTNTYKHYVSDEKDKHSISSNAIWSLFKDSRNKLWVGTWAGGLNLFNPGKESFTRILHDENDSNSILSNNIFSIIEDDEGDLWLACMDGGISRYDIETDTYTSYLYIGGGNRLSGTWVRTLLQDSYDYIWISTTASVQLYDKKKDEFINYNNDRSDSTSISYDGAVVFYEDSKKNMWIGTEGGLNLFNRDEEKFVRYRVENGLPDNIIQGICEDAHGNLWISTNKGISKFSNAVYKPGKPEFINFDERDGLQGNAFNRRSFCKDNKGRIYFGGNNGFNVFHPDSIQLNTYAPEVVLTDFLLFNEPVEIGTKGSPLSKHISMCSKITLDYKSSYITIYYTALNYLIPEKNQYAYMLDGFDKDWNYAGNQRFAKYTNLDPGKYIFKVIASNNDGYWNTTGVSLEIHILPPWWMRWWFRILAVLVVISSLILFYLTRLKAVKRRNIYLEQVIDKRTREISDKNKLLLMQTDELNEVNTLLEERQQKIEEQAEELRAQKEDVEEAYERVAELNTMKDRFFSIIGHDLKNPIHTIMGFSDLLKRRIDNLEIPKRNKYLDAIQESSSQTYELLENLLDWARTQTNTYRFHPVKMNLQVIIETVMKLLKQQYEEKNISIKVKLDNKVKVFADQNMIETIFRNLISNAIKFTDRGGEINVLSDSTKSSEFVTVTVADNGTGIPEDKIDKMFRIDTSFTTKGTSGESGTGLGLILCGEFVKKNGGKIWVESEEGKGSRFIFTLPKVR